MVSRNLWISYFSFAGTNLVVQQVFFFIQKTKAGQWKIFIFGDFSNDFNAYVFFSLDFIGICSYMVTSSIITGMMQISENWPGKSSKLLFNDFAFLRLFPQFCYWYSKDILDRFDWNSKLSFFIFPLQTSLLQHSEWAFPTSDADAYCWKS